MNAPLFYPLPQNLIHKIISADFFSPLIYYLLEQVQFSMSIRVLNSMPLPHAVLAMWNEAETWSSDWTRIHISKGCILRQRLMQTWCFFSLWVENSWGEVARGLPSMIQESAGIIEAAFACALAKRKYVCKFWVLVALNPFYIYFSQMLHC